jgi:hypothetical protein
MDNNNDNNDDTGRMKMKKAGQGRRGSYILVDLWHRGRPAALAAAALAAAALAAAALAAAALAAAALAERR